MAKCLGKLNCQNIVSREDYDKGVRVCAKCLAIKAVCICGCGVTAARYYRDGRYRLYMHRVKVGREAATLKER
jgi:hypothetical protein